MSDFLNHIIPPDLLEEFIAVSTVKAINSGDFFIRKGDVPRKFAFVRKGLFRYFYVDDQGAEYTKNLIPENSFVVSYTAMINQTPSHFYIEALEDSEIMEISYQSWIELQKAHRFWDQLLIKMLEYAFGIKEKRERELLLLNAETRYQLFHQEFPGMEDRITQKIIASYLGIHPESLSRIRKNKSS